MKWIKRIMMLILILTLNELLISCVNKIDNLAQAKIYYNQHDYPLAFDILLKATANGNRNPEAQYALGYMYYYGLGIAKDQDIGRLWICKAAAQHYLPAMRACDVITQANHTQLSSFENASYMRN